MSQATTYIVVDIETDGPVPGRHAMLNLAAVAMDQAGKELGTFSKNLVALTGTEPDPDTLAWWKNNNQDVWAQITADPLPAQDVMAQFDTFVRSFEGRRVFVSHPLIFDGLWVSYYMETFLGQGLMAFHGTVDPLFFGAGIDLPSFVAGALGNDYGRCRHGRYPAEVATDLPHTHLGLDDARGHADVLRKTLTILAKRHD